MRISTILLATAVVVGSAGAALAHHSAIMFDHARLLTVQGTVKTFAFASPHSWVALVVKQPGAQAKEWDLEGEDTIRLIRDGLARDTVKPGDQIAVGFYPLHDGRPVGQLVYLTAANGRTYGPKPSAQPQSPR